MSGGLETVGPPPPGPGEAIELLPDLWWVRIALPLKLDHVNLWLLREGRRWTVIDAGPDTDSCRTALRGVEDRLLGGGVVESLIVTHGHVDHIGLSGWLTGRWGARLQATRDEWYLARHFRLSEDLGVGPIHEAEFLERAGCSTQIAAGLARERSRIAALLGPVPDRFDRLLPGMRLSFGGRTWEVMVFGGHSEAHAMFFDRANAVLIAGDHVLPDITPIIGVYYWEPKADPLAEYLASLERLKSLPGDTLVLPSHGRPFRGLHARIEALLRHHADRLRDLGRFADRARTPWDVSQLMFPHAARQQAGGLALAETLAHMNHGR